MNKEILCQRLRENNEVRESMAGRFSLWSGKVFTYQVCRNSQNDLELRIVHVRRENEKATSDFGRMTITPDGKVVYFSFHSVSGENEFEYHKAKTYIKDCDELLIRDFIEKVTADYASKIEAFSYVDYVDGVEKELREALSGIEKEGGVEKC